MPWFFIHFFACSRHSQQHTKKRKKTITFQTLGNQFLIASRFPPFMFRLYKVIINEPPNTPWVSRNSCARWGHRKWHHKGMFIYPVLGIRNHPAPSYCHPIVWSFNPSFMMSLPGTPSGAGISAYPGWTCKPGCVCKIPVGVTVINACGFCLMIWI